MKKFFALIAGCCYAASMNTQGNLRSVGGS